jgi:hypothetical protein
MIFAEILSEIAYIPVFPVESAPCKFPIPVPFGIKKFTDFFNKKSVFYLSGKEA